MDITQRAVVTLLKSAITGESYPLPQGFSLAAVYPSLKKHHMDALLYEGAVRCGISRKEETMQSLFRKYCKALLRSEGQMAQVMRITQAFDDNGIDYMPLKGCKLKSLYPKPEMRTMGDADILVRMEQYEKIVPIMESLGFAMDVQSDHEYIWRHPQLLAELHKRLIPSYNEDFYAYFREGWQMARPKSGNAYEMTPEDEFVYLFTHFSKHFRDGGIGCRYVLDLWVYRRANPNLDTPYLRKALESVGLLEFYENIRDLMAVWFEDRESDPVADLLTDYIFASGSWGGAESHALSQMVRSAEKSGLSRGGKLLYLQGSLFPKVTQLETKYPVLKKAPWMLPLVWLYRPFYKVLFERKDVKRKQMILQKITAEGVDARREMLRYVGLDFPGKQN